MKIEIVLKLKETRNADIIVDAQHYINDMTGNNYFTAADIVTQIAKTQTATTNMINALDAPTSDTKTADIKIARLALDLNLKKLKSKVEDVANNEALSDEEQIAIVHSAGMKYRVYAIRQKGSFTAKNTAISGTALLRAKGMVNGHEWQYTLDLVNFSERKSVDSTTKARALIEGLNAGSKYAFFHKAIIAKQTTAWEGPVFLLVT